MSTRYATATATIGSTGKRGMLYWWAFTIRVSQRQSRAPSGTSALKLLSRKRRLITKLYIDEVTLGDLLGILIRLPWLLVDLVKEELDWWLHQYKYEIYCPDWQEERLKGLAESRKRMAKGGKP